MRAFGPWAWAPVQRGGRLRRAWFDLVGVTLWAVVAAPGVNSTREGALLAPGGDDVAGARAWSWEILDRPRETRYGWWRSRRDVVEVGRLLQCFQ